MIRIWGKIIKDNKIVKDMVSTCHNEDTYAHGLTQCINEICDELDIEKPYWLPINQKIYNQFNKTSFNENNFIDNIEFDKFVIEELEYVENM